MVRYGYCNKLIAIVRQIMHCHSRRECHVSAKSKFIAIHVPAIRHVLMEDLRDACRWR